MSTRTSEHDRDAAHLVDLYAERVRLTAELAAMERKTRADYERVMAAGARLDEACDQFRRRHYPRRARVITAGYSVMVCSATLRRVEMVYEREQQACGTVDAG